MTPTKHARQAFLLALLVSSLPLLGCNNDGNIESATDGSSSSAGCVDGYENCPCTTEGLCLGELMCVAQMCVPSGGVTAGESDSMSSATDPEMSESDSESGSSTSDTEPTTSDSDSLTNSETDPTEGPTTDDSDSDSDSDSSTDTLTTDGTLSESETDISETDGTESDSTTESGGGVCGDGVAEMDEACDGDDLAGESCVSLGYLGGALACTDSCTFDEDQCTNSAVCGDGLIVPGVLCYKPPVSLGAAFLVWLATGDFDEDGHLDILGGSVQSGLRLWLGDGEGDLSPTAAIILDVAPRVIVDLDHDGHLDVIGDRYGDEIGVAYGDGLGGFTMGETYDTFSSVTAVALGDVNGDSWDDIAVGNAGNIKKVSFRLGIPGGMFGPQVSYTTPRDAYVVGFLDIDHDNNVDLWAFTGWGDFLILKGDGAGNFSLQPDQPQLPASSPRFGTVAHFNGDQNYDIALFDNAGGNLHARLGQEMGFSEMLYSYQVDNIFPFSGVAGNFDGNNALDLAGFARDNVLDVFRGDGNGLFFDGVNLEPGLHGRAITAGDFNEDGIDDFVTSHAYTQGQNLALKITLSDP